MKAYVIIKEDHGYHGYGTNLIIDGGPLVESVYTSFEDAWFYLQGNYKNLYGMQKRQNDPDCIKGKYRYFDENNEHAYQFTIFEKEIES